MTLFWIVGAVVFFGLLFLMFRRRVKQGEKRKTLEGVRLTCVSCGDKFDAALAFKRTGLRGDLFVCPVCGNKTWMKALPPPEDKSHE